MSARLVSARALALVTLATAMPVAAQPLPARWPRAPLTEVAREAVRADLAWERYGLQGRGSVLCLVDTGADASHPDLTDAAGATRVRWVLDTFAAPRGRFASLEARFGGAVFRGDEDELPGDPHGHGTAMASIALGDGSATDIAGPSAGLAPAAALIVVRAYDPALGGFPDDAVVNGVGFCRALAAEDPSLDAARMVVLLSLGGHDGAHDGLGAFESALAEHALSVPIVVAAGNDGARAVHAAGRLFTGERSSVEVRVPRSERADAELALTVRVEGGGAALASLESPEGALASLSIDRAAELPGAHVRVEPLEGDPDVLRILLSAREGALGSGTYRLRFAGPLRFDVWLAGARLGPTFLAPSLGGVHVRAEEAITIPATSAHLISVGATVARGRVDAGAAELRMEGVEGERASFSAPGPTPSGIPKPDLVAPGGWILAALSRDVREGDPENLAGGALSRLRTPDGRVAVRGTSAAAAVVAGALLLALELDPAPAPHARAILVASARGARAWSPGIGAGVLDVERLLALWSGTRDRIATGGALTATRALVPSDGALWISARVFGASGAPAGERLTVEIDGRTSSVALAYGVARVALPAPPVTIGSTILVRSSVDGVPLPDLEVPVVLERGARRVTPAGGCAVAPRAPPRLALFGAALYCLLATVRRARSCRARCGTSAPARSRCPRRRGGHRGS